MKPKIKPAQYSSHAISLAGRNTQVSYLDVGAGVPVVLVHGSLADQRYWAAQMATLSEARRILALTLPHYWQSHVEPDRESVFSIDSHAEDVAAFIAQVIEEPVHVVGHSRGANVALALARRWPNIVRTLVLADPGGQVEHAAVPSARLPDDARTAAATLIGRGDVDAGLERFIDSVSGPGVWQRLNSRRKGMARDNAATLPKQLTEAVQFLDEGMLAQIDIPILLMGGEHSPAPYPAIVDALSRHMPSSLVRTIKSASHAMNAENPSDFNAAVQEFWDREETHAASVP